MNISNMARKATAVMLATAALGAASMAQAQQNSIFPAGWDSNVRDRLFMRLGYTTAFLKTKAEDARDITGDVISLAQLQAAADEGRQISIDCDGYFFGNPILGGRTESECLTYADANSGFVYDNGGVGQLLTELRNRGLSGLGTPPGIKAKAQSSAGTPTLSVGFWLDEGRKWLLEGFVLAAPLKVKIYGDGVREDGTPNGINGRHIATTKILPPLVVASYNFGDKNSLVRPYLGVGAMYAVFFGGKTTSFFDSYQGGKTTLSTRNTFGAGPFVGIQSDISGDWHVNLSVGYIPLRTTSRLVTTGTQIKSGDAVLFDYPSEITRLITVVGEDAWSGNLGFRQDNPNRLTTNIAELVRRTSGNKPDLGTFVREQKMKITNTIVTVSVGRSF